jgi:chitinase
MSSNLANIISQSQYLKLAPAANAKYSYQNLLDAGKLFPDFCSGPNGALELAAFIANTNQETGQPVKSGYGTCPDGSTICLTSSDCPSGASCGLNSFFYTVEQDCIKNMAGCASSYCDPTNVKYPCSQTATATDSIYFGRGPLQLSWNYNYGTYGDAVKTNFIDHADDVLSGPHVFGTAVWFWMTSPGPDNGLSCHQAMQNNPPDFGRTVFVINGGIECKVASNPAAMNRGQYFKIASSILGASIPAATNFDCSKSNSPQYLNQAWCGSSWADSQCRGKPCFDGTNASCGSNTCYLDPINYCGTSWSDSYTNMQNNQYPCYSGVDQECQQINSAYRCNQVKYPYICGSSYADACNNSKNPSGFVCNSGTDKNCPSGTTCFAMPDTGCPNYSNC